MSAMVRTMHPGEMTRSQKAALDLLECFDGLWQEMPPVMQDFTLRFLRSNGMPVDYPPLPFWAERAARHFFTICYPTLRKSNWQNPSQEDFGKAAGHMLALKTHALNRTAIFQRLPDKSANEARDFFIKIQTPLRILIDEGLNQTPDESAAFLRGLNFAFARTFDATGWPKGWSTNSWVLIGLCYSWKAIVTKSPSLPELHKDFVKALGENLAGSEERIKSICHRIGLRFSAERAALRACLKKDNIRMDAGMGSAWGWSGQKKRMNGLT